LFLNLRRGIKSKSISISALLPIIGAIGIAATLLLAEHTVRYLLFPYPLDDGEGFCLNQAKMLASGEALYPPVGGPPYVVTNYPPVFPYLLSFLIEPENVRFLPGRMLSVISTIITCIAAAGCVKSATDDRRAAWVAALMVAASSVVYFWGALVRVDVLATALGMVALWIAMGGRGWGKFWSIPFVVAALFTRQSSVEAALAIAVGLYLDYGGGGNTRKSALLRSVLFVVLWAVLVAVIVGLLQGWSDGEFWKHTVVYTRTKFYPLRVVSNAQWIFQTHAIILIVAFLGLSKGLADRRRLMLGVFFIAAIGTSLLSGKMGSDLNYFLNLIAASACLAGCFSADLFRIAEQSSPAPSWLLPAALLIPAALAQSGLLTGFRALSFTPTGQDYANGRMIVDVLSAARGPILSEDEGFCLLSGHEVLFNPFIMSELAREGVWDQSQFVDSIRNREFEIIMLRFDVNNPYHDDRPGAGGYAGWDRFTPEMEQAISGSYEIDPNIGTIFMRREWHFYRPKQAGPEYVGGIENLRNLLESDSQSD
jgi:hypothetical protein